MFHPSGAHAPCSAHALREKSGNPRKEKQKSAMGKSGNRQRDRRVNPRWERAGITDAKSGRICSGHPVGFCKGRADIMRGWWRRREGSAGCLLRQARWRPRRCGRRAACCASGRVPCCADDARAGYRIWIGGGPARAAAQLTVPCSAHRAMRFRLRGSGARSCLSMDARRL